MIANLDVGPRLQNANGQALIAHRIIYRMRGDASQHWGKMDPTLAFTQVEVPTRCGRTENPRQRAHRKPSCKREHAEIVFVTSVEALVCVNCFGFRKKNLLTSRKT